LVFPVSLLPELLKLATDLLFVSAALLELTGKRFALALPVTHILPRGVELSPQIGIGLVALRTRGGDILKLLAVLIDLPTQGEDLLVGRLLSLLGGALRVLIDLSLFVSDRAQDVGRGRGQIGFELSAQVHANTIE
jgi:hypothetical protein